MCIEWGTTMKLNELKLNEKGKIKYMNCNEEIKRRLLDLGLIKGTIIEPVFVSPVGDPKAFNVRGTIIAIRLEETEKIILEE